MKEVGYTLALFSVQSKQQHKKELLHLDTNGIKEDKHYGKNIERSILIASVASYKLANETLGIAMSYGYLGENLLISYNPYHLEPGKQLKIGEVVLEITQNCTLCNHLAVLDKRIPKLLKDNRGIFAKVVTEGVIKQNDPVFLLS